MFCQNCGTNLPDGAAFCTNCGAPIQQQPGQAYQSGQYGQYQNQPPQQQYQQPGQQFQYQQNPQPIQRKYARDPADTPNNKKKIPVPIILIVIVLVIAGAVVCGQMFKGENIEWEQLRMSQKLPAPPKLRGEIEVINEVDQEKIDIYHISREQFDEYIEACAATKFDLKQGQSLSGMFEIWYGEDPETWQVSISYDIDDKIMHITLAPSGIIWGK